MHGRTLDEFWSSSPAQIGFVLKAYHQAANPEKRKGTVADAAAMFGKTSGVKRVAGLPAYKPGRGPND